jgi:hypothetical protein
MWTALPGTIGHRVRWLPPWSVELDGHRSMGEEQRATVETLAGRDLGLHAPVQAEAGGRST